MRTCFSACREDKSIISEDQLAYSPKMLRLSVSNADACFMYVLGGSVELAMVKRRCLSAANGGSTISWWQVNTATCNAISILVFVVCNCCQES